MHSPREFSPAVQRGLYWAARGWSWALCLEFLRHPGSPQASISSVPCFSALCFLTCSCICSHGGGGGRAGGKNGASPQASIWWVPCFSALCFLTCSCICSHGGWRGRAGRKIGSSPRL